MTNLFRAASLFAVAAIAALMLASPASAQATRTWISGVGNDANPCSRTAPCKTFAGAIALTAAGGEIDTLDPGGFGAVTVTKAITLAAGGCLCQFDQIAWGWAKLIKCARQMTNNSRSRSRKTSVDWRMRKAECRTPNAELRTRNSEVLRLRLQKTL